MTAACYRLVGENPEFSTRVAHNARISSTDFDDMNADSHSTSEAQAFDRDDSGARNPSN